MIPTRVRRFRIIVLLGGLLGIAHQASGLICIWTGASTTNWSTAGNWSSCGGGTPGALDTAIINNVANDPTLSGVATVAGLSLNGGSVLTVSPAGNLTLDGPGGFGGSGDLIVNGLLIWKQGIMAGAGTTTINAGGSLQLLDGGFKTLGRTLLNHGTGTMFGTSSVFFLQAGGLFHNIPSGVFTIQNTSTINGAGTFQNDSTFNRSTSTGVATVSCNFINTGSVNVNTGTLRFAGGTSTHGGTYNFSSRDLEFTGGTHTVTGSLTGDDLLLDAAVNFNAAATLSDQVADVVIGGPVTLNTGEALTFQTILLDGSIAGSDGITSASWTWDSGTLGGTGTATVPLGGSLTMNNSGIRSVGRVFNNSGTATLSGTNGSLAISAPGSFNNLPAGTFTIHNVSVIGSNGTFNNAGTFNRSTSSGIAEINCNWVNTGTVNVNSGTLFFGGTGTHGGTYLFAGHVLYFSGAHSINGSLTGSDLVLMGSDVTFNPAATISNQVANVMIAGGTKTFNTGEDLIFQSYTHTAGNVTGSDNITSADWTWNGGTFGGTGTGIVPGGGALTLASSGTRTLARAFQNSGTATLSGTTGLVIQTGTVFANMAAGFFTIQNDSDISGPGTFQNAGNFSRAVSLGNATVSTTFNNTGTVNALSGNLTYSNFTQTAGATLLDGGNITAQTNPLRIQGGSLEGTGTVTGNVLATTSASVAPGGSPGTLTISGTYTQSPPAAFDAEINAVGAGNFDVIAVGGQTTLGGVLNVPALPFTPVAGNNFPLMTYASRVGEFGTLNLPALPGGLSWLTRYSATQFSLRVQALLPDLPMRVDTQAPSVGSPNLNGVIDPGENVVVAPRWRNPTFGPITFTGAASNITGPAGATYAITDAAAGYGTINGNDGENDCILATGNCYEISVSNPAIRPSAHWDVTFDEALSNGDVSSWTLHVGNSFNDVSQTEPFYRFIETLFHVQITGGCGGGAFCPLTTVTRGQMSVFLLKSRFGVAYVPPAGTGTIFLDVPLSNPFVAFIEDLAARGVTGGCGFGNYCPNSDATREQMAVFLLVMLEGLGYQPPACVTPTFNDVPCSSGFARWIEELARRGITGGCGGGAYCPTSPVTRGQMAVFLTVTFALRANGP